MNPLLFVVVCLLCTAPHLAFAQRCEIGDQERADEEINLADFVSLLAVEIPETCDDLAPLSLLPCRDELDVVAGCCMRECRDLFEQYTAECLQDLTEVLCQSNTTVPAVAILDGVASRCDNDYIPLECPEDEEEEISQAAIDGAPADGPDALGEDSGEEFAEFEDSGEEEELINELDAISSLPEVDAAALAELEDSGEEIDGVIEELDAIASLTELEDSNADLEDSGPGNDEIIEELDDV